MSYGKAVVNVKSEESKKELLERINLAIQNEEKRARARTIGSVTEKDLQVIYEEPAGALEIKGGDIARSYPYRAETTELRLYWWRTGARVYVAYVVARTTADRRGMRGISRNVTLGRKALYLARIDENRLRRYVTLRSERIERDLYARGYDPERLKENLAWLTLAIITDCKFVTLLDGEVALLKAQQWNNAQFNYGIWFLLTRQGYSLYLGGHYDQYAEKELRLWLRRVLGKVGRKFPNVTEKELETALILDRLGSL
jgi:hypothetical protein